HGADALRALLATAGPVDRPEAGDARAVPEIAIGTDEHRVNAEAAAALAAEPDLFQRGGMLVHVTEVRTDPESAAAVRRPDPTPAHLAGWLAGLLTPPAWFAFDGPAPLFLIDGNTRGVGKGLLADVIALTVTGRRFPAMSYTADREELRKRITTLAVEGERAVL